MDSCSYAIKVSPPIFINMYNFKQTEIIMNILLKLYASNKKEKMFFLQKCSKHNNLDDSKTLFSKK